MQEQHAEKWFACSQCERKFTFQSQLREHEYSHLSVGKFVCTVCKAKYRMLRGLCVHKEVHTKGFYHCGQCSYKTEIWFTEWAWESHTCPPMIPMCPVPKDFQVSPATEKAQAGVSRSKVKRFHVSLHTSFSRDDKTLHLLQSWTLCIRTFDCFHIVLWYMPCHVCILRR